MGWGLWPLVPEFSFTRLRSDKNKRSRSAWMASHAHACVHTIEWPLTDWFYNVTASRSLQHPPPVHNAVWLNKQHTPAVQRQGERKRKRRESREVKKALATPLCSFHWCQRQIGEFPSRSHPFFLEPLHRSFCAYPYKYASKSTVRRKSAKKATKLDYSLIFPAQKCVRVKSVTVFSARLCRLSDRRSKLKHFWVRSVDAYQPLQRLSCWLYRSQHGAQQCCHGNG